jgi:hypothetical protein
MTSWQISTVVTCAVTAHNRYCFIQSLISRGFSVKLRSSQLDMYRTTGDTYTYDVSHKDSRALTMFLLVFDASDLEIKIIEL